MCYKNLKKPKLDLCSKNVLCASDRQLKKAILMGNHVSNNMTIIQILYAGTVMLGFLGFKKRNEVVLIYKGCNIPNNNDKDKEETSVYAWLTKYLWVKYRFINRMQCLPC